MFRSNKKDTKISPDVLNILIVKIYMSKNMSVLEYFTHTKHYMIFLIPLKNIARTFIANVAKIITKSAYKISVATI